MKPEIKYETISTRELFPFIKEMLSEEKKVCLTVTGNSMLPLLRGGMDSVELSSIERVKKRDVVLYERENGDVIFHRVIACKKSGYMILGDNQTCVDGPVPEEKIAAVMTGFHREGVYVSCRKWWYRIYSYIWTFARPARAILLPLAIWVGKGLKRLERMG